MLVVHDSWGQTLGRISKWLRTQGEKGGMLTKRGIEIQIFIMVSALAAGMAHLDLFLGDVLEATPHEARQEPHAPTEGAHIRLVLR